MPKRLLNATDNSSIINITEITRSLDTSSIGLPLDQFKITDICSTDSFAYIHIVVAGQGIYTFFPKLSPVCWRLTYRAKLDEKITFFQGARYRIYAMLNQNPLTVQSFDGAVQPPQWQPIPYEMTQERLRVPLYYFPSPTQLPSYYTYNDTTEFRVERGSKNFLEVPDAKFRIGLSYTGKLVIKELYKDYRVKLTTLNRMGSYQLITLYCDGIDRKLFALDERNRIHCLIIASSRKLSIDQVFVAALSRSGNMFSEYSAYNLELTTGDVTLPAAIPPPPAASVFASPQSWMSVDGRFEVEQMGNLWKIKERMPNGSIKNLFSAPLPVNIQASYAAIFTPIIEDKIYCVIYESNSSSKEKPLTFYFIAISAAADSKFLNVEVKNISIEDKVGNSALCLFDSEAEIKRWKIVVVESESRSALSDQTPYIVLFFTLEGKLIESLSRLMSFPGQPKLLIDRLPPPANQSPPSPGTGAASADKFDSGKTQTATI